MLAIMASAWPKHELPGPTVDLWCNALKDIDPQVGLNVAKRLVTTGEWFPTISRFVAAAQAESRRLSAEADYHQRRALPAPVLERLRAKAYVIVCKELMGHVGNGGTGQNTHRRIAYGECAVGCEGCAAIDARVDEVHRWLIEQERGAA